ncbi:MAG: carbohydrate binding domain-containing protein [Armatimonadetes bacterium]|nr:carbohydrate binding domain-containing protein [Armatimonadota bacterium]
MKGRVQRCWWTVGLLAAASQAAVIFQSGFEEEFPATGVPAGWVNDTYSSWGGKDVSFARDADRPHGGQACWKVTLHSMGYITPKRKSWIGFGNVQVAMNQPLAMPLVKGRTYRVRAWVRGRTTTGVTVFFRKAAAPYTTYTGQTVLTGDEWRLVEWLWTAGLDDPDARFMIRWGDLGSVWLDDVSVEEVDPAQAGLVAPPDAGNLLSNGDFDLGLADWATRIGWDNVVDPGATVEPGDHGPCLKVSPAGPTAEIAINSEGVPVTPGRPIHLSLRIKSDRPVPAKIGAVWMDAQHVEYSHCDAWPQLTGEWQTLEMDGTVGFSPAPREAYVHIHIRGPVGFLLDDVVLRQDGQTADVPRPRAALIPDRHPVSLYHDGEPLNLRLTSSIPDGLAGTPLAWRITDYWGRVVRSGAVTPGAGRKEQLLPVADLPRGWFRTTVEWPDGPRRRREESTFCILPPAGRAVAADDSPFAGHFQPTPLYGAMVRSMGAKWLRLWPPSYGTWDSVEPEQGKFKWADDRVDTLVGWGLKLCGVLEGAPKWITAGGTPEYWAAWENYVAKTVEHYRGRVQVWEVQNEPDLKWWTSRPEGPSRAQNHFEYLKHTYPVIKRMDPGAQVMGGCVSGFFVAGTDGGQFADELLELGALQYMDILSYHYYYSSADLTPLEEQPETATQAVERIRTKMRDKGRLLPIVNSEGGFYNPGSALTYRVPAPDNFDPIPAEVMARMVVKLYVEQIAAGVSRFFFYNCMLSGCPMTKAWDGFIEGDGQPRPIMAAYGVMTWILDGAKYERTDRPRPDVWMHRFTTPRGPAAVVWSKTGTSVDLPIPHAVGAWDLMGQELDVHRAAGFALSPEPIYVQLAD